MACLVKSMEYLATVPPRSRINSTVRSVVAPIADEFDQGGSYGTQRPRGSNDWLLIYTVEGAGLIARPGLPGWTLSAGQVVLLAPGAFQDYRTDPQVGRWRLLWTHFHPRAHWAAWLRWPELAPGMHHVALTTVEARAAVSDALRRMIASLRRPVVFAPELAMAALEDALLWIHGSIDQDEPWLRVDARVRRAMDYLATNAGEPFRLEAVARHCGLSPSRLGHLFKAELDMTPQRFSEELRVQHAQRLLVHTTLSVGEVAAASGYADAFYFAKRFRRATGTTPTAWRRRSQRAKALA